jgi:carbamoyltransferase
MKILGISALFHDAAAALAVDGEIVAAAQEERFSRIKHDARMPIEAVKFCLEQAGLTIDEVDAVVFYEKPLRKFERILVTHLREFPRSAPQFARTLGSWLGERLFSRSEISKAFDCDPGKILFLDHHLSHAASAFYCSPFSRAAIVTVDGVGEWATTTIARGVSDEQGSRIEAIAELRFPHSIGLFYSALTAYLGFEVNEGEYKVMGLAAYGTPRFEAEFEKLVTIGEDGSIHAALEYFSYQRHLDESFTPALVGLLGPARVPGSPMRFTDGGEAVDAETQRFADVAATLQKVTERAMLAIVRRAKALTGETELCLAGGVALNSVANGRIVKEGIFEQVFVQPAAGDAGGAVGAALHASHALHGVPRRMGRAFSPFLGKGHGEDEVAAFVTTTGLIHERITDPGALDQAIVDRLARGEVGGFFRGRFEWGPRALGARSIIADPRGQGVRDRVNAKVKFREPFRPFAPVVLASEADRFFEMPASADHLSRYMLTVVPVRAEARGLLPAITHVDGTARVQTIEDDEPTGLARLVRAFFERTGMPVLLNTSMNLKDEPLVGSPAEAFAVFLRSDLDFLVLENCLIDRASLGRASKRGATTHGDDAERSAA